MSAPGKFERIVSHHPVDSPRRGHALRPRAAAMLRGIDFSGLDVLDIGTGRGRLALLLASRSNRVVGIDIDRRKLELSRARARERGLSNVEFLEADAEDSDYRRLVPSLGAVVANLCISIEIVRRAGEGLGPGGRFAFTGFHQEQWKETGKGSSHALSEAEVLAAASGAGLRLVEGWVEVDEYPFSSPEALVGLYVRSGSRGRKWKKDGRLDALLGHARSDRPVVTEAFLTAHFNKP